MVSGLKHNLSATTRFDSKKKVKSGLSCTKCSERLDIRVGMVTSIPTLGA